MTNYYVLKPEEGILFGKRWAYADIINPSFSDTYEVCPKCNDPVGPRKWLPPYQIKLSSSKPEKWGDFVWGAGFPLLVSARFKEIYEAEKLTGIQEFVDSVEIKVGTRKSGNLSNQLPVYYLIQVPWGGANQDDLASGVTYEKPEAIKCSYCRIGVGWRKQKRIVIDESSWDGTDIFRTRGAPVNFIVSERFKQIDESYHLKNIWLIPSEKYSYDERRAELWHINE